MITFQRIVIVVFLLASSLAALAADPPIDHHYLYVAAPGIRNDLQYGGHGLLVFDIDNAHQFVKRIPTGGGADDNGVPLNVKGICASAVTGRVYISSLKT